MLYLNAEDNPITWNKKNYLMAAAKRMGIDGYENKIETYGEQQLALLGWGSMFHKSWISVLDRYIEFYGKDDCLFREADRIFTLLQNKHHNFVPGGITHLKGKDDENALCNQSDHISFKNLAIERCLKIN